MTRDLERFERALWETWRHHNIAPRRYRDLSWEELCQLAKKSVGATQIRDCAQQEVRALFRELREPSDVVLEAMARTIALNMAENPDRLVGSSGWPVWTYKTDLAKAVLRAAVHAILSEGEGQ